LKIRMRGSAKPGPRDLRTDKTKMLEKGAKNCKKAPGPSSLYQPDFFYSETERGVENRNAGPKTGSGEKERRSKTRAKTFQQRFTKGGEDGPEAKKEP